MLQFPDGEFIGHSTESYVPCPNEFSSGVEEGGGLKNFKQCLRASLEKDFIFLDIFNNL